MSRAESWDSSAVYCVPALVDSAVQRLTGRAPGVQRLAEDLGVKVRSLDEDIWGLGVATDTDLAGISREDAVTRIPCWLLANASDIIFEYIPLSKIINRDAESFCQDASRNGWIVGASVNWNKLVGRDGEARHVIEVHEYSGREVSTFDSTAPVQQQHHTHDPQKFESAMFDVNGGFWIFKRTK